MLLILCLFLLPANNSTSAKKSTQSIYKHKAVNKLNTLFKKYIFGEYIAYERLLRNKEDRLAIKLGFTALSSEDPSSMTTEEQKAFWINIYNIAIIDQVLDLYPIKTVMDVEDFFKRKSVEIKGLKYSFDDIEKKKLKDFKDPRVHFALVCASMSCPNIEKQLYEPNRLNFQLDQVTERFITNHRRNKISEKSANISMLFKWYVDDFGGEAEVRKFINRYVPLKYLIDENTSLNYIEYDWRLNGEITGRQRR